MRPPFLVTGGLLAALLLAIISVSLENRVDIGRQVGADIPSAGTSPPMVEKTQRDRGSTTSRTSPSRPEPPAFLPPDIFEQALSHLACNIPLPDHTVLPLLVTRSSRSADGSVRSLEGTLNRPAPGRFIFHRQPPGALPGPFAGVVFFPSLDYGYRLESFAGRPVLVRRPAGALACLAYYGPEEPEVQEIPADHPDDIPVPAYQNGVIPLQSLPGATGVLYLDFDGEEGPHEGWGDFDADSWNFSNSKIKDIWERVAEDYAPFNLNVTTDLEVFIAAPETSRQRCIVTRTKDAAPEAGGIAYLGSFNWTGDTPCWAFLNGTKTCAETISHELGHTLTLGHDGRTTPSEAYYTGHGSGPTGWAPIMGSAFTKDLTQWSKGEYLHADNPEDDLQKIATNNNLVSYRDDDHGTTHATATPLGFAPSGEIDDQGIIETDGDVDAFRFTTTTGGSLDLSVAPVVPGANLDVQAELHDQSGTLLESSNPVDALGAVLSSTVAAGTYTIRVTNTGKGDPLATGYSSYATLGEYTLGGTIPGVVLPDFFSIAENPPLNALLGTVAPRASHGANPLSWAITSGNGFGAFQIDPDSGALTVADPTVLDVESLSAGWNDPPEIELVVAIIDTIDPALNESIRVLVTVLDVNEAPIVNDASLAVLEHTVVGRSLLKVEASDPDEFDLLSFAITAGDPDSRFAIDAGGHLSPAEDLAFAEQSGYTLTITATDSGTPALTATATVTINLVDTVEGYLPGQVEHTFYREIDGNHLANLTSDPGFPECPDDIDFRPGIHARGDGDNYGRVVRAFLIPPLTGNYTFWIAGDDDCQLDLSGDADPANATTIASFNGWTDYQEWDRFPGQKSASFPLVAGQAYYLEARQKEGGGGDHLSLAWEVKDGSDNTLRAQEPLPGLFLAPHALNYCPRLTIASVSIRDNAVPGSLVHHFKIADLNAGDTHNFEITSGNPGRAFAIDPATGRVRLADNSALAPSYQLGIRVTDSGSPPLVANTSLLVNVLAADTIAATGPLLESWDNIAGTKLDTLTASPLFPDRPGRLLQLTGLDSGEENGTNFGARIRAYLTPPSTGDYTFYLAGDDQGILLLSTDQHPANATQICRFDSWTGYQQWNKFPLRQTSSPISLLAGQRYFIEARVKEGGGNDHLSVGWTGPGIASITAIHSSFLEPYDSNLAPDLSPLDPVVNLPAAPGSGTPVATFSALDSPFETINFALLDGNDGAAFAIDPQSGELAVANPAALHPGPYTLTIGAQDSGHGGYFPLRTATTTITIFLDDADRDTLPDPWEIAQFGNLAEAGNTDPDLDGLSNRAEFLFGTLANDHFSFPRPEANGVLTPATAQFSFPVRNDASPANYQLSLSTNLLTWTTLNVSEYTVLSRVALDSLHERVTIEVPRAGTHCFLRLGVD